MHLNGTARARDQQTLVVLYCYRKLEERTLHQISGTFTHVKQCKAAQTPGCTRHHIASFTHFVYVARSAANAHSRSFLLLWLDRPSQLNVPNTTAIPHFTPQV